MSMSGLVKLLSEAEARSRLFDEPESPSGVAVLDYSFGSAGAEPDPTIPLSTESRVTNLEVRYNNLDTQHALLAQELKRIVEAINALGARIPPGRGQGAPFN